MSSNETRVGSRLGSSSVVVGITTSSHCQNWRRGRLPFEGPPIQVLLGLWGRPHSGIEVTAGDPEVWHQWRALPSEAFQFGAWD